MKSMRNIGLVLIILFCSYQISFAQTDKDFSVKKIDFIKMSTKLARVRGELINNSSINLRHADFVIKVFNENKKLIAESNFTIRNFIKAKAKNFNTTIKANVKHISSYKIEFKGASEIPPSP